MKLIAISQRLVEEEKYFELREVLALDWGKLFSKESLFKDFLPFPLSYEIDFEKYKNNICAVILSGGNNLYCVDSNELSKKRDEYERKIISYCIESKLPILGICRGAQMIAHYFKSNIIKCDKHLNLHNVKMGDNIFIVNSFHNFCISKLGENLIPLAYSGNTIEAFKHEKYPIYGIMWHIEREKGLINRNILKEWISKIKG